MKNKETGTIHRPGFFLLEFGSYEKKKKEKTPFLFTETSFPTVQDISSRIVVVDDFGIVSDCRGIIGNIFGDHASRTDGHIVSDLHIFDDADVRSDIDIVADRCRMFFIAADGGELGKIAVVSDDGRRVDDDWTAMGDI